jgi:hypothetical protein
VEENNISPPFIFLNSYEMHPKKIRRIRDSQLTWLR